MTCWPSAAVVSLLRVQAERGSAASYPPAGVHRRVRAHPATGGAAPAGGHRSPSRAHGAGGRDRRRGRRPCLCAHHPPGEQRRGHTHGRVVPAAGSRIDRRHPRWRAMSHPVMDHEDMGHVQVDHEDSGHRQWTRERGRAKWTTRRSMAECMFVIPGGTVVDATGEQRADVLGTTVHREVPLGSTSRWGDRARRRRLRGRARTGRPPHPPARARARGGRDGRDRRPRRRARGLHRGGGHAQHRARHRLRGGRPSGARARSSGLCEVAVAGAITVGRAGRAAGPHGRAGRRSACGCSPTTAPGSRTAG